MFLNTRLTYKYLLFSKLVFKTLKVSTFNRKICQKTYSYLEKELNYCIELKLKPV